MFRLLVALSCLSMTGALSVWAASAQSVAVLKCVRFDPNPQADETQHLGWLKNICTFPIAVVHDFGLNADGTPRDEPWCSGRASHGASLQDATLLDPGETLGVGWTLKGVATQLHVSACSVDTSQNNAVYITQEEPEFRFSYPSCDYECQ